MFKWELQVDKGDGWGCLASGYNYAELDIQRRRWQENYEQFFEAKFRIVRKKRR